MEKNEVVIREVSVVSDVQPERWNMMLSQAEAVVKSGICPAGCTKEKVAVIMLTGREFGLGAMQSLRSLYVVNNKAAMMSDMMAGLVFARLPGAKIDLVESTDKVATFEASRPNGKPRKLSFTMEDAKKAQLTSKDTWIKYPAQMLRARCQAGICRLVFPDIVAGLYTPEELGEEKKTGQGEALIVEATIEPTTPPPATPPKVRPGPPIHPKGENTPWVAEGIPENQPEVGQGAISTPPGDSQIPPEGEKPPKTPTKGKPLAKAQAAYILKQTDGLRPEQIDILLRYAVKRDDATLDNLSLEDGYVIVTYLASHKGEITALKKGE